MTLSHQSSDYVHYGVVPHQSGASGVRVAGINTAVVADKNCGKFIMALFDY